MASTKIRSRGVAAAKVLVGVGLLAWLVASVDMAGVAQAFRAAHLEYLAVAVALYFVQVWVQAVRLHLLVGHVTGGVSVAVRLIFIGQFLNNFLPGNIGGDGYKVVYLKNLRQGWGASVAYIMYDRLMGLGAIVGGAALYLIVEGVPSGQWESLRWQAPPWLGWVIVGAGGASVAVALAVPRVRAFLVRMRAALARVTLPVHAGVAALAVATVAVQVVRFAATAACFGGDLGWVHWLYVIALSNILALLPVSVGGLGVQEGVTVYALTLLGVPESVAVAIAFINRLSLWLGALLGGGLFLSKRTTSAEHDTTAAVASE